MLTTKQVGIALVATAILFAPIVTDGPGVLWLVSVGLGLIGARLATLKPTKSRERKNKEMDVELDDDDIDFERRQDSGSRNSSRHSRDDAHSDDTDWDIGSD